MKIDYDEKEDTVVIQFRDEPIIQDISYGWNVTLGMTTEGIGQISLLDAKTDGLLPIQVPKKLLGVIKKQRVAKRPTKRLAAQNA